MAQGRLGWLFGILTGAVLGVLFAPRRGKELRRKMEQDRKKGGVGVRPLGEDLKDVGKSLHKVFKDIYQEVRDHAAVKEAIDTGKDYFGDYIDEAKEQLDDLREKHDIDEKVKRAKTTLKRVKKEAKGARTSIKKHAKQIKKTLDEGSGPRKNNSKRKKS
ncbi:hypothetical protein COV82_06240 [Candidatus Peregrinibacteria bacterium CG11_big_fil_rev_8_21_14_0_20_46_8]|nr:MAG: hypothetical protein COV82_06240 [Candidatus Peregrinibacteria bacterium CG11_big_fil_rev_8_21_14_0_20_46_8]